MFFFTWKEVFGAKDKIGSSKEFRLCTAIINLSRMFYFNQVDKGTIFQTEIFFVHSLSAILLKKYTETFIRTDCIEIVTTNFQQFFSYWITTTFTYLPET